MVQHLVRASWVALMMICGGAPAWAHDNAYIANVNDGTISVISTASDTVTATIAVGYFPIGVAVTSDGSKVYVTTTNDTVWVIATVSNTVTAIIPVGVNPQSLAVSRDGSKVYVANIDDNTVSVISTASNAVTATIPVGTGPFGVAVTPDGSKVYVANNGSNTVSVISTAKNVATATISVGSKPDGIAVTPDGSKVYVATNPVDGGTVSVVATASGAVTATIPVGGDLNGVAVSPDGSKVYVANPGAGTVQVIATASNTVIATIADGTQPQGPALTADGSKLYVANYKNNIVSVIATVSNTVADTISVGNSPFSLGQFIGPAPATHPAPPLVSAILPGSRSVYQSSTATVFATMVNATASPLSNCYVANLTGLSPAGLRLSFQTTSSATNAPVGPANTPATIPASGSQSFVLSFTSDFAATFPAFAPTFRCDGVAEAAMTTGVNTVDLLFSPTHIPDVIALAASTTPGVVTVPFSKHGAAAFAVATDNVGVDGTLTVKTDTGGATLPLAVTLCQTNSQGACLAPPSASVSLDFAAGSTPTFSFFVTASGSIPFNPANARIFVRFLDDTGASHGSTSLAVDTD